MKKFKLLAVAVVAGLLGLTAQAASTGYASVSLKVTGTFQTNSTDKGSTTTYHVIKVKITNKEMLKMIATEFVTNFPSGFPSGSKLVVDAFWGGNFSVLDKTNGVLLANANFNPAASDLYSFSMSYNNWVYTGKSTSSTTTYNYNTIGDLSFENGDDSLDFAIYGFANVNDKYPANGDYDQSYDLNGADDAYFGGGVDSSGVSTGSVKGSGNALFY